MSDRIYLNEGWEFTPEFSEEFLAGSREGQPVRLPHTCAETPYNYFSDEMYQMVSGYRRKLFAPLQWKGKRVLLTLEGAAHDAEVFVNGVKAGSHHCGYTAFTLDLSAFLTFDAENTVVVRLDSRESLDQPPFGFVIDYMTYGGLYREAYLEIKNSTFIADLFVYTPDVQSFAGQITTEGEIPEGTVVCTEITDGQGKSCIRMEAPLTERVTAVKAETAGVTPWTPENPALYYITVQLVCGGTVLDSRRERFGFRTVRFDREGFFLNGEKRKLFGLNRHQCYPYVGYAMPASMQRLDADILRFELGCSAVRTSHYPQSQHFIDRCDEIGLLVFTEIPGWQHIGGREWQDQAVENVREMVMQYRNHPSIYMWGVRINESADLDEFYRRTNAAAHELDPTRPTGGVRNLEHSHALEDVYTYNDFSHTGENPGIKPRGNVTEAAGKGYMVTECNGHMFPTKMFDSEEHRLSHALRHAAVLEGAARQEGVGGLTSWCMFDYNTHQEFGSGDRICYHGVMDMFRNPKLAAAVYASQSDRQPVLTVSGTMDIGEHPAGTLKQLYVFTNADSVKMYINDEFVKEFFPDRKNYVGLKHPPVIIDDFIGERLEKGEGISGTKAEKIKRCLDAMASYPLDNMPLRCRIEMVRLAVIDGVGREKLQELQSRYHSHWGGGKVPVYRFEGIRDGKVTAEEVLEPSRQWDWKLTASVDHTGLREENTYDVASVRIAATDPYGHVLPFLQEPVLLKTEGEIQLIGPEVVCLQGGCFGTYVKTTGRAGTGRLAIRTESGRQVTVDFTCETAEQE